MNEITRFNKRKPNKGKTRQSNFKNLQLECPMWSGHIYQSAHTIKSLLDSIFSRQNDKYSPHLSYHRMITSYMREGRLTWCNYLLHRGQSLHFHMPRFDGGTCIDNTGQCFLSSSSMDHLISAHTSIFSYSPRLLKLCWLMDSTSADMTKAINKMLLPI